MDLPRMMKALVAYGLNDYRLVDKEVPAPGPGEVLIHVEGCGICAGDLKAAQGAGRFWGGGGMPGYCEPPFVPGHEFFGTVAALGAGMEASYRIGERVIPEQIVPCGQCRYCQSGRYWLCGPHDVFGFKSTLNGGMAEYALLPKNALIHRVPESFTLEQAALIEPFACALHAVDRAQPKDAPVVVLAGCGTLGLGMVAAMQQEQYRPKLLVAMDMIDDRLRLARAFGADLTVNPGTESALDAVLEHTDGYGCDVYIEATGHPSAVQQGLDMIAKGGRFVEFSVFGGPSTVDWSIIGDAKEIDILGSSLSPNCFPPVIQGIERGGIQTEGVVSHRFALDQWKEAFEVAHSTQALKVVLVP